MAKKKCGLRRPTGMAVAGGLRRPSMDEEPYRNPEVLKRVRQEIAEGKHVYDRLELEMSDVAERLWNKKGAEQAKTDHGVRPLLPFFFGIRQEKFFKQAVTKVGRPTKSKYPDGDTELLLARLAYLDYLGHGAPEEVLNWWRKTKDGKAFAELGKDVPVFNPRIFVQEE